MYGEFLIQQKKLLAKICYAGWTFTIQPLNCCSDGIVFEAVRDDFRFS